MSNDLPISLLIATFTGALMLLIPHISPRRYYFAITVPDGFPASPDGRKSMRRYYVSVVCSLIEAAAMLVWLPLPAAWLPVVAMLVPAFQSLGSFLWERKQVARMVPAAGQVREADLSPDTDRPARWIWLALPPFALPLAAAVWLRAHWNEIPARFPIHWDLDDVPNGWADKSVRGVFGPLIFAGGLMMAMILMTLAMYYGSRRGRQRTAVTQVMIAAIYFLALVFSATALMPIVHFPTMLLVIPGILFPLAMIVWAVKMARDPDMPVDQTPDECWYLGGIYVNSKDPAIFVQKRIGFGYTVNMGNRLGWLILGGFVAAIAGLIFVLPG